MMNADNPLDGGLPPAESDGSVVVAPSAARSAVEASDYFQSREELRQWLTQLADEQWGSQFGQRTYRWGWYGARRLRRLTLWSIRLSCHGNNATSGGVAFASSDSHSVTNTQVAGVDEADFVETDGEYLYVVSGKTLTIVKLGVGDELSIAARVELDDDVAGMYLDGDRLALISRSSDDYYGWNGHGSFLRSGSSSTSTWRPQPANDDEAARAQRTHDDSHAARRLGSHRARARQEDRARRPVRRVAGGRRATSAGAGERLSPSAAACRVSVEGESEPTNEALYQAAPVIGGEFRLMVDYAYHPGVLQEYVYETREEYINRVIDEMLDNLPGMREIGLDGEVWGRNAVGGAPRASFAPRPTRSPRSLRHHDRHDRHARQRRRRRRPHASSAAGAPRFIPRPITCTCSPSPTTRQPGRPTTFSVSWKPTTKIWKFGFDAESHDVQLSARGSVNGTLLNQFAVDEHEGHLRLVTSDDWSEGQTTVRPRADRSAAVGRRRGRRPWRRAKSCSRCVSWAIGRSSSRSGRSIRCSPSTSATPRIPRSKASSRSPATPSTSSRSTRTTSSASAAARTRRAACSRSCRFRSST